MSTFSETLIDSEIRASVITPDAPRVIEVGRPPHETVSITEISATVARPPGHKFLNVQAAKAQSPPPLPGDLRYFKLIKNWEGVVVSKGADTFFAHIRDTRDFLDQGEEDFEIQLDHVPADDQSLVREGAIFFLTIGYWVTKGGQRSTDTRIVFRRMPKWSANDISKAHKRADEYLSFFGISEVKSKIA